jgi:hypothetical protein
LAWVRWKARRKVVLGGLRRASVSTSTIDAWHSAKWIQHNPVALLRFIMTVVLAGRLAFG